MALSWRQRRALRDIEEHLAAEDPALAGLLRRAGASRIDVLKRWVTRSVVAPAVALLLLGLVLADLSLVFCGLLMSVVLRPALWLISVMVGPHR